MDDNFESQQPCQNPNCRSYGRVHPNCRCHGGFAEGGLTSFCAEARGHDAKCEYFADGGDVAPDFDSMQDHTPQPSAAAPTQDQSAPDFDSMQDHGPSAAAPQAGAPAHDASAPNFDDIQDVPQKDYNSTGQQILTGVEGAAQGLAGPVATLAEQGLSNLGVPGLSDQDIKGREHANPGIHGVAKIGALAASLAVPGLGEYSLAGNAAKIAGAGAEVAQLGKLGAAAIQGAISNGLLQASDETTKAMLGQGGDPSEVMSHIAVASGLGFLTGGMFNVAGQGLARAGQSKIGNYASEFLQGVGAASKHAGNPEPVVQ